MPLTSKRKRNVFRKVTGTTEDIFLAMVSANGVRKNRSAQELLSGVATLEDLFNHD